MMGSGILFNIPFLKLKRKNTYIKQKGIFMEVIYYLWV